MLLLLLCFEAKTAKKFVSTAHNASKVKSELTTLICSAVFLQDLAKAACTALQRLPIGA